MPALLLLLHRRRAGLDLFARPDLVSVPPAVLLQRTANNPPQIVRSRLSNIIPCSGPAKQRHKIIGNRLALVGEESVSGVTAEPRRVNQEHPLMRVYIIGNYAVPHGAGDTQ